MASNQNQVSPYLHCNARPASFNKKDGSISFQPQSRNEANMVQDSRSLMPLIPRNQYRNIRNPCSEASQIPGREPRMFQGSDHLPGSATNATQNSNLIPSNWDERIRSLHLPTDQLENTSNWMQHSHLLPSQMSTNGFQIGGCFQGETDQLSTSESHILRRSFSSAHPLLSNGFLMTGDYIKSNILQHSVSLDHQVPSHGFQMAEGFQRETDQLSAKKSNILQRSVSLHHQLPSNGFQMSEGFQGGTDQLFTNESQILRLSQQLHSNGFQLTEFFQRETDQLSANKSNILQRSVSLDNQVPSQGFQMVEGFQMETNQLSANKSNILQRSVSLHHQLPSNGFQLTEYFQRETDHLSVKKSNLERSVSLDHQQPSNGIDKNQNLAMFSQQPYESTNSVNVNRSIPSVHHILASPDFRLPSNEYQQYSENVNICVVGPPSCGKADLIRTFARDHKIQIPTETPYRLVTQQKMTDFGTTLQIDIWHSENLTLATEELKTRSESSKSAVLLVYSVAQRNTQPIALEWFKVLKPVIGTKVPVILVGNNANVERSRIATDFRISDEYKLSDFYQCSTECVGDVDKIFLSAVLMAIQRKKQ